MHILLEIHTWNVANEYASPMCKKMYVLEYSMSVMSI